MISLQNSQTNSDFASRYIGLPWVDRGCGFDGCDCWGLLRLIYQHERGVALPSFSDRAVCIEDRADIASLIDGALPAWREVAAGQEQTFDGVLMRDGSAHDHIGMVTEPGRLIHVARGGESEILRYRFGTVRHRVVGFFRLLRHE